jgi:hypothetical protein
MSSELLEELEVLVSIYDSLVSTEVDKNGIYIVKYRNENPRLVASFTIPTGYPTLSSPHFSLSLEDKVYSKNKSLWEDCINSVIKDTFPEVVVFNCIQTLKELLDATEAVNEDDEDSENFVDDLNESLEDFANCDQVNTMHSDYNKYNQFASYDYLNTTETTNWNKNNQNSTLKSGLKVIHGPTTEVSKSTFQSHVAEVHSMIDVKLFKEIVLSDKKVRLFCFPF